MEHVRQNVEHGLSSPILRVGYGLCATHHVDLPVKQAFEYAYVMLNGAVLIQCYCVDSREAISSPDRMKINSNVW